MTPEQKSFIEGIEAAAKHILELFPKDTRPDGVGLVALQIKLFADRKRAEFKNVPHAR
jgi:hypothetical protein